MAEADVVFAIKVEGASESVSDLKKAEEAFDDVGKGANRSASEIGKAGGAWERFAGGFQSQLKALLPSLASLGAALAVAIPAAIGAAVAALGVFVAKSIQAAAAQEESNNRLRAALEAQGVATQANVEALSKYASAIASSTRYTDEAIVAAQALGLRLGVGAHQIADATQAAVDMSAALGIGLDESMTALAKTLTGTGAGLRRMGVDLGDMSEEALRAGGAIQVVGDRFRNAAERDTTSLVGGLTRLKNAIGEATEAFGTGLTAGQGFGEMLNKLADVINGLLPSIEQLGREVASLGHTFVATLKAQAMFARGLAQVTAIVPGVGLQTRAVADALTAMEAAVSGTSGSLDQLAKAGEKARASVQAPIIGLDGWIPPESAVHARLDALMDSLKARAQARGLIDIINMPMGEGASAGLELGMREREVGFKLPDLGAAVDAEAMALMHEEERTRFVEQQEMRAAAMDAILQQSNAMDAQTAAIERQREAWLALDPAMRKHAADNAAAAVKIDAAKTRQQMFTSAIQQTTAALIQWAISGEGSLKKILSATLTTMATQAGTEAIMQVAHGLAMLARVAASGGADAAAAAAATAHFASAKTFGLIALGAGAGAIALGSGGEGSGGSGGGRDTGGGRDNSATVEATQDPALGGSRFSLVITGGQFVGTTEEWFRRDIGPLMEQYVAEGGGRSSTGRG